MTDLPTVLANTCVPRSSGAAPRTGIRVALAGRLTALAAPGGGEVQMLDLLPELQRQGLCADFWRPWSAGLDNLDVLHLFGSAPEFLPVTAAAQRRGVRVALSTIAWFDLRSVWGEPRSLPVRLTACGRYAARRALSRWPTWRRRLYHAVDALLPNSQAESDQLVAQFGVPQERIHVVPNAADLRFAAADPAPFARLVGQRGFVLCPGRIEPRKNQLQLLQALRGSGAHVVVLGDAAPGQQRYYDACRRAADEHVRFVPRLDHAGPLLASAYAACGCLALCSWYETPGLVALEAAQCGVPLVLTRFGCTREYFGRHATYVHPGRRREIRQAVLAALRLPRSAELSALVRQSYTWEAAALATGRAYAAIL